jgi:PmbA protein
MEKILDLARKSAEKAEVYWVSSEETPVHFQANRLKSIDSKQSTSVSLRIIKNGRLGYAAASGEIDPQKLVDIAVETSQFGMEAKFDFPASINYPDVKVLDPEVNKISISEMIDLGQSLIDPIIKQTPGIMCDAAVGKDTMSVRILNTNGGRAEYQKSTFGLGVSGTLIRDTDMLFVGEGEDSCHPIKKTTSVVNTVLRQLDLAKNLAVTSSGNLPVIFTPDGLVSAFIPALMSAFNGKTVLEGASPIGQKLGEQVFNSKLSLYDDPTIDFAPNSRPSDDEGVPSQRTPLIEKGKVSSFIYDLQTAGQAKAKSTGSGSRGRGGLMSPSPSAFVLSTGKATFQEMIENIKEGLVIEQLMGAEQGNVLGGDFSGNVLLGYKIENGKIVGRVKNTMVSGNIYQLLKDITLGQEAKWVGSGVYAPHLFCPSVSVASK